MDPIHTSIIRFGAVKETHCSTTRCVVAGTSPPSICETARIWWNSRICTGIALMHGPQNGNLFFCPPTHDTPDLKSNETST